MFLDWDGRIYRTAQSLRYELESYDYIMNIYINIYERWRTHDLVRSLHHRLVQSNTSRRVSSPNGCG
jgi:hypothetical protein